MAGQSTERLSRRGQSRERTLCSGSTCLHASDVRVDEPTSGGPARIQMARREAVVSRTAWDTHNGPGGATKWGLLVTQKGPLGDANKHTGASRVRWTNGTERADQERNELLAPKPPPRRRRTPPADAATAEGGGRGIFQRRPLLVGVAVGQGR